MKRAFAIVLTCVLSLLVASIVGVSAAAPVDDCACQADDGSCSTNLSCQGKCISFCGDNGNCFSECSGGYEYLAAETTLEIQDGTYPDLVTKLVHLSGKQLVFFPRTPNLLFNAQIKRSPFWTVLDLLSDQGAVQVNGQDFERIKQLRRILLSGDKIKLCVRNTPVATFVNDMTGLTGLPLRVTAGSPMSIVNIKIPQSTLDEMLFKISEQTGTKIQEVPPPTSANQ